MNTSIKRLKVSTLLATVVVLVGLATVQAGSINDYGQLASTPAQATYVAWLAKAGTPPSEVLTEDSYNSGIGPDQGYQSLVWYIKVGTGGFATPAALVGDTVNMTFSESAGTLWTTSFSWSTSPAQTGHGTVAATGSGTACPVLSGGSQSGNQRTIDWTGPAGTYLVYRSTQGSGPGSGRSNGRYQFIASVTGFTYTDTVSATENWYIIVPTDANGNITGCHSPESNSTGTPTAVRISTFRAAGVDVGSMTWAGVYLLGALALGAAVRKYVAGR